MLYVKLAIDRAMAKARETEEKQPKASRAAQVTPGARRVQSARPPQQQRARWTPSSQPPMLTDSEWMTLSAQEQLAWAKNTQDPRIAVGSHSPLEKKIKSLGGIHSSRVRKLLVREFQQENATLDKLKAVSFDFRFAKAEAYYFQKYQEMMMEAAWDHRTVPEWKTKIEEEEKRSQSEKLEDAKTWDYLVSERELSQIEKHIHRAERARGLRDHKYRLLPQRIPSEILSPKTVTPEEEKNENVQKPHKTQPKKRRVAWAKKQIKGHQDRMIRGRELTGQRNDEREAQKISSHIPPLLRPQVEKEEVPEFERVRAYPILQPCQKALLEVTIMMKKAKEDKIEKPLRRELLSMPPFLRSQLEKNKV